MSTGSATAEAAGARTGASDWVRRDLIALAAVALIVRLAAAVLIGQPGYTDAFYYYDVAANLAAGRGFVEDFIWNYLRPVAGLPQPSNGYWPPLVSVTIAPFLMLFGDWFRAAQIPSILGGTVAALIGFRIGRDLGGSRRTAWWTGLWTLFPGVAFPLIATTDSFGLFAALGSATLWLIGRALTVDRRYYPAAGALAGLAALTRADGLLLVALLPLGWRAAGGRRKGQMVAPGWAPVAGLAVCLLVMAPWLLRNLLAFGEPLPGAGIRTVFLRDYNEIFSYPPDLSLGRYLEWGIGPILLSKIEASGINLLLLASLLDLFAAPFALIGIWAVRARPAWWPALAYLALLCVSLSWVFTLPGQRGAFFHSAVALQPYLALAALIGLDRAIDQIGRRFPRWPVRRARRNYPRIALAGAVIAATGLAIREAPGWDAEYEVYRWAAGQIADRGGAIAPVMVADAPAYFYVSRRPAIAAVNADLGTALSVAHRFGAEYLLIEPAHPAPWHDFYLGRADQPGLRLIATRGDARIYAIED